MQGQDQAVHKPGAFKQQNKAHKTGRHRSKGTVEAECRGRVPILEVSRKAKAELRRKDRRNKLTQMRKNRRLHTIDERRQFDGPGAPPFLTAVLSLTSEVEPANFVHELCNFSEDCKSSVNPQNTVTHLLVERLKKRFSFVVLDKTNLPLLLDAIRVADSIAIIWPQDGCIDQDSERLLSVLCAHGVPAALHVVKGFKSLVGKRKEEHRQTLTRCLEKWFQTSKFYSTDAASDLLVFLRSLAEARRKRIGVQSVRSHLLVESFTFRERDFSSEGTLEICGYLRGHLTNVNGLVELVGFGVFQMEKIEILADPHCIGNRKHSMELEASSLCCDPKLRESLQSEAVPESLDMEQCLTDSISGSATLVADGQLKKVTKKVPKGTSDYQAAWIVDEGNGNSEESEASSDEEAEETMEDVAREEKDVDEDSWESAAESGEESGTEEDAVLMETASLTCTETNDDQVGSEALEEFRRARENQMFPDEVDTPLDVAANVRFQKYRGLKSFRASPWDHRENLPFDYGRIFQFQNFRSTKKRLLAERHSQSAAPAGAYVCIHVSDVPKSLVASFTPDLQLTAFFLLPHEQKMSVLNMVIQRDPGCTVPIKSKEKLIFQVGFRRFIAAPIFSQHTSNDKHKYERYLPDSGTCVATVYAPIIFPPAPVIVLRRTTLGDLQLVATGSILDYNPNRMVIKRVVLSGHPYKINRKSAVVRFMFFNREDISWFKPVELSTKYGRKGHIKEPLGTHGHMKCVFDGQLNSQDTVMMKLYKRVFPKWSYSPCVKL